MKHGLVWVFGTMAATIVLLHADAAGLASAWAADIAPHRALYTMSLGQTHGDAGVTGAGGTMAYQWGEVGVMRERLWSKKEDQLPELSPGRLPGVQ